MSTELKTQTIQASKWDFKDTIIIASFSLMCLATFILKFLSFTILNLYGAINFELISKKS